MTQEGWARLFPAVSPRTLALRGHRMPAYLAEELWMQALESGEGKYCEGCDGAMYVREGCRRCALMTSESRTSVPS